MYDTSMITLTLPRPSNSRSLSPLTHGTRLRQQASFLQQDLPLHVVLTKGKAAHLHSRSLSRREGVAVETEEGEYGEEWSTLRAGRRELVGTAEIDWR